MMKFFTRAQSLALRFPPAHALWRGFCMIEVKAIGQASRAFRREPLLLEGVVLVTGEINIVLQGRGNKQARRRQERLWREIIMDNQMDRRNFLRISAVTAAGAAVTNAGLAQPATTPSRPIRLGFVGIGGRSFISIVHSGWKGWSCRLCATSTTTPSSRPNGGSRRPGSRRPPPMGTAGLLTGRCVRKRTWTVSSAAPRGSPTRCPAVFHEKRQRNASARCP